MHIEAKNLVKRFKEHTAVDRVSLRVEKGEIVGENKERYEKRTVPSLYSISKSAVT